MRSSSTVFILISFFLVKFARSQSSELLVHGQTGKLYLEHTVVVKENWYSIGRLYNISPKELAPFNKLALTQPLAVGQTLEIPLTAVNFSQNGQKQSAESLVPVYYIIQEKEWMYRVSVNHNKVPIPSLEKWNNMTKDQVHAGQHLIVGYLKVKTALSALAAGGGTQPIAKNQEPAVRQEQAINQEPAIKQEQPVRQVSTVDQESAAAAKPVPAATTATPEKRPPVAATTDSPAATPPVKQAPPSVTPTPKQPVTQMPAAGAATTTVSSTPVATPKFNGGAFKGDFSESGKSAAGQAGTFKSTSGWQDGKYYALMNNTPVGTIVRVNDPTTGKSIYAKILGQLPDMKESAGLAIRISNAAAAELGEGEGRFTVEVKY